MNNEPSWSERNRLLRDAEHHFDRHNFDGLLELASSVCLRSAPDFSQDEEPLTGEQAVIARLGMRGINLALDTIAYPDLTLDIPSTDDDGNDVIGSWFPLREPGLANGQFDFSIQRKIDMFGTALLEEAYVSLGHDVAAKIGEFNAATSVDDQIAVLEWVNRRVRNLKVNKTTDTEGVAETTLEDFRFYHPAMLSTKMLGRYPWHNFDPTCLGKSLLTASFIAQTQADSLHAGVMRTQAEENFRAISTTASLVARKPQLASDSLLRSKLKGLRRETFYGDKDPGFHAATLVRLMNDQWYILDPNYESRLLSEEESDQVAKAFEDISGMDSITKGTERIVTFDSYDQTQWFTAVLHSLDIEPNPDEIADLLDAAQPETLQESVWEWFLKQVDVELVTEKGTNMHLRELIEMFQEYEVMVDEHYEIGILQHNFLHALESYVLWDDSPEVMLERFKHDSAYRTRRIEDVAALPYAVLLSCQMDDSDARIRSTVKYHLALEVGKPSYRIGAAVLSDFATYCGDDLSYSFWSAHWPSLVPITERYSKEVPSHHWGLMRNNLHWLDISLRYTKQDGIVQSFLSGGTEE